MADIDPLNADFARRHPESFARILGRGDVDEIAAVLEKLPPDVAASVVSKLPASRVGVLLARDPLAQKRWLVHAPLDDAITLLSRIPREQCLALVNSLRSRERKKKLLRYLNYPAHSVGTLVGNVPISIAADAPVENALADLRTLDADDPEFVVVLQEDGRYFGVLNQWALLSREQPTGQVRDYTISVAALHPETTLLSASREQSWNTHNWLPVVDHDQRLLGGISRAAVFRAVNLEESRVRPWTEVFAILLADLAFMLGDLLEQWLGRRRKT